LPSGWDGDYDECAMTSPAAAWAMPSAAFAENELEDAKEVNSFL
jgi:hypothetical protein